MKKCLKIQEKTVIIHNQRLKGNYWHAVLFAPGVAKKATPGQFINARISSGLKPFLRRPFSIHDVNAGKLEVLYEVLGEGTRALSRKPKGESLDIIGPLGNGFSYPGPGKDKKRTAILVSGGIGIAPLLFLSKKIKAERKIILIGAKSRELVIREKEFKNSGYDVKISTDDGSRGFKGRVTELLKVLLTVNDQQLTTIYACGPRPMLKEVCAIASRKNILTQVSLEEHMSCGIGACLGCAVRTKNGLERVCKEGPVFFAEDLIWAE